jgi:hypothetical protein
LADTSQPVHEHAWRSTGHLDSCHSYSTVYACTGCAATASISHERDYRDDPYALAWGTNPDCERCVELAGGAAPRTDVVIVGDNGEIEREEHK